MSDYIYTMQGSFSLTNLDKKNEMNELILDILRKTGVGRLTTRNVNGKDISVFRQAAPDDNGIIEFDFSIFEKFHRKGNYYNTNTCELVTPDIGYRHFKIVMILIMTVLEAYSETPYYLMFNNYLSNVKHHARMIEEITGKVLDFKIRAHFFDTTMYFRKIEEYKDFSYDISRIPFGYCKCDRDQFEYTFIIMRSHIANYKEDELVLNKEQKMSYECLNKLQANANLKDEALEYITELMDMSLEERKLEKERKHPLDFLSDVAEFLPAPYLVQIYAEVFSMDFTELWLSIGKKGYWDVTSLEKESEKDSEVVQNAARQFKNEHNLMQVYKRDNEDDFIGIWNNDDMIISSTMKEELEIYKSTYSLIDDDSLNDFDTISELISCLDDLENSWNIRKHIEYNLLEEFLNNKEDICYKKAVYTLRKLINNELLLFPELTESQLRKWVIGNVNTYFYTNRYWHYLDVLSNSTFRKTLFGF